MRTVCRAMAAVLFVAPQFASAANSAITAAITAPITDVVLYPGSATIVRMVQVGVGKSEVAIAGLPAQFDAQTLHAEATPGITVGEIVTRDQAKTEAISPNEANLDAKIQALEDQQAVIDAEIQSQEIVKNYLEKLNGAAGDSADRSGVSPTPYDAKRLAGLIETIGHGARDALLKIQALSVQKRELVKEIDALKRDLARQHTGDSDARSVNISINAERAGSVKLSYQVKNAGWKPVYRATLDSAASTVDLDRLATVSQKTGEDWSNVHLTLSTNQPNLAPTGPEPQPWLLVYHPPLSADQLASRNARHFDAVMPSPVQVISSPAMKAARPGEGYEPPYTPPIFESQSTFSTQFDVPARVNLSSDGREVTVTLSTQRIAVKQFARIVPRLDRNAIVMADAERLAGVWPRGQMQLIRDGNYVGATNWRPDQPDPFVFSFGRDDLIKVERNDLKSNSASTGFIDKRSEYTIANQYVVTNNHRSTVNVEVLESSPVSTSDEIQVKTEFDPKPTSDPWSQKRGVIAWSKSLAPDEAARFTVNYTVEYPREGTVSGLR